MCSFRAADIGSESGLSLGSYWIDLDTFYHSDRRNFLEYTAVTITERSQKSRESIVLRVSRIAQRLASVSRLSTNVALQTVLGQL